MSLNVHNLPMGILFGQNPMQNSTFDDFLNRFPQLQSLRNEEEFFKEVDEALFPHQTSAPLKNWIHEYLSLIFDDNDSMAQLNEKFAELSKLGSANAALVFGYAYRLAESLNKPDLKKYFESELMQLVKENHLDLLKIHRKIDIQAADLPSFAQKEIDNKSWLKRNQNLIVGLIVGIFVGSVGCFLLHGVSSHSNISEHNSEVMELKTKIRLIESTNDELVKTINMKNNMHVTENKKYQDRIDSLLAENKNVTDVLKNSESTLLECKREITEVKDKSVEQNNMHIAENKKCNDALESSEKRAAGLLIDYKILEDHERECSKDRDRYFENWKQSDKPCHCLAKL